MPSATSDFQHKKGDSFDYTLQMPLRFADGYWDTSIWTPSAKIKTAAGATVASDGSADTDIVLTWDAAFRNLNLFVKDTTGWAVIDANVFDVQFTRISDSYVVSTATKQFDVISDVT